MSLHWLFSLAYGGWMLCEAAIALRDARNRGGEMRDRGTRSIVILALVGSITAAMMLQRVSWARLPIPYAAGAGGGVALMVAGMALRLWAVRTLGVFFTPMSG
jgi:protein-S-isoprenylcysteine O-methyltransferase Ste14